VIVQSVGRKSFRATLEVQGGALALFSPGRRSQIIKRAMREAGYMWLFKWVPMRFTPYAFRIGYRVSKKWANKKIRAIGKAIPFIGATPTGGGKAFPGWSQVNGAKMCDAIKDARLTASGNNGREVINIKIPYGHAIQNNNSKVFRRVAPWEMDDMARVFERRMASEISGAKSVIRKGVARKIPRPNQRASGGVRQRRAR